MRMRDYAIIDLYRSGASLRECGKRFGITGCRVHQILSKAGEPRRPQGKGNWLLDAFVRKAGRAIILEAPETPAIIARAFALARSTPSGRVNPSLSRSPGSHHLSGDTAGAPEQHRGVGLCIPNSLTLPHETQAGAADAPSCSAAHLSHRCLA